MSKVSKQVKEVTYEILCGIDAIGYWACIDYNNQEYADAKAYVKKRDNTETVCIEDVWLEMISKGNEFIIRDLEDRKEKYLLTFEAIEKGIEQNAKERPWDNDLEYMDGDTVDCLIQYALFGEIVFG